MESFSLWSLRAAKNVILAGVKSVTLHDTEDVKIQDLSAQFYLSKADVGKNRAEACRAKLQELNTAVAVSASSAELAEDLLSKFQVLSCQTPRASWAALIDGMGWSKYPVEKWQNSLNRVVAACSPCCSTGIMLCPVRAAHCMSLIPWVHVQVIVATNCSLKQAIALDNFCHRTKSTFIRADVRGVFASVFCDFGPSHTVLDVDGDSRLPHCDCCPPAMFY